MQRILVTGGAGFLGSHLCERLLADGHRVLCLDDFSTGRERNLQAPSDHAGFELRRHDVVEPYDADVDVVVNLACPASPPLYQRNPVHTLRTSVWGAWHGLELARKRGAKFVQASTSEVYGDPGVHPQPEDYPGRVNPIGPRACYDEGKRAAEALCFDFRRQHGTRIAVARIFNTYGPRLDPDDGRVVSNFIVQALAGEPLTVYGDGSQTRSFCYVDDLVDGLVRLIEAPDEVTGPINLGNPDEHTVRDLAEQVIALTGSASTIVERPLPADDPARRRPDIARARRLLDWQPQVSLDDGLQRTIAWFRRHVDERGR